MRQVEQGNPKAAKPILEAALRNVDPESANAGVILNLIGVVEFMEGRYVAARRLMERSLQLIPEGKEDRTTALINFAQVCKELGDLKRAEELLREGLRGQEHATRIQLQLGQVYYLQGRFAEAEQAQRAALATVEDPVMRAVVLNDLGLICEQRRNLSCAIEMLRKGVELSPSAHGRAIMRANLGRLLSKSGDQKAALTTIRQAIADMESAVGPEHPDVGVALMFYAETLKRAGNKQEAKAVAQRAKSIGAAFSFQTNSGRTTVDWRDLRK